MASGKDEILINDLSEDIPELKSESRKGSGRKVMIIFIAFLLVLVIGGFSLYSLFFAPRDKTAAAPLAAAKGREKPVLFSLEPFILNLSDPGRHLKVAVQFELTRKEDEPLVQEGVVKLRDAIIMLLSSKTADAVSSPEGKFQLKDEMLLRANQVLNQEVFKNVYFTEFVMQ